MSIMEGFFISELVMFSSWVMVMVNIRMEGKKSYVVINLYCNKFDF